MSNTHTLSDLDNTTPAAERFPGTGHVLGASTPPPLPPPAEAAQDARGARELADKWRHEEEEERRKQVIRDAELAQLLSRSEESAAGGGDLLNQRGEKVGSFKIVKQAVQGGGCTPCPRAAFQRDIKITLEKGKKVMEESVAVNRRMILQKQYGRTSSEQAAAQKILKERGGGTAATAAFHEQIIKHIDNLIQNNKLKSAAALLLTEYLRTLGNIIWIRRSLTVWDPKSARNADAGSYNVAKHRTRPLIKALEKEQNFAKRLRCL